MRAHRGEHLDGKAQPVLQRAAVVVRAPVADRRDEARQQISVRAVQLEHVEAGLDRHARRAHERSRTRPCPRASSRAAPACPARSGSADGAITSQPSRSSGGPPRPPTSASSSLCAPSARAAGRSSRDSACTKSMMRRHASTCSSLYMPVQPGVMRASGGDAGHLGDDEPRAAERAAAEVHQMEVVRRAVDRGVHVHRRDDDAVGERHPAQAKRREHRRWRRVAVDVRGAVATTRALANHRSTPERYAASRRRRFSWPTRWLRVSRL